MDQIATLEEQRKLARAILENDSGDFYDAQMGIRLAKMVLDREEWEQKLVEASAHGDV